MMATLTRQVTGRIAEEFAFQYLTRTLGWTVLERNWRCRVGELDIVAEDRNVLVIVEVRSRSGTAFGTPADSIAGAKAHQLQRLVPFLLNYLHRTDDQPLRIDAVAVHLNSGHVTSFDHLRNLCL